MDLNLIKKDVLEIYRSKKLLILAIVFLFVAVSSPALAKLMPELFKGMQLNGITISIPTPTAADAIDQFVKNIGQIGLMVIIFLAAGSVVEEKTRHNLEILLTKPVSRARFIIAKFISLMGMITLSYLLAAIIFYVYTASIFGAPDLARFAILAANLLLYVLMIVGITLWGSTVSKNTIMAAGVGFLAFIVFGSILGLISAIAPYAPGYIFDHYSDLMASGWSTSYIAPMLVCVIVIVASLVGSIVAFRNQEIDR